MYGICRSWLNQFFYGINYFCLLLYKFRHFDNILIERQTDHLVCKNAIQAITIFCSFEELCKEIQQIAVVVVVVVCL